MILSLHGRIRVSEYRILLILCSGLSSPLNTVMDEEITVTGQQIQDRYRFRQDSSLFPLRLLENKPN